MLGEPHQPPKIENTIVGRAERFIAQKLSDLRGHIGCRLDLSIQEVPSLKERERVYFVLEALSEEPELSEVSSNLLSLLQEIHQALLAHTLSERHAAFCQAITRMESSEPLKRALRLKFEPPDDVSDREEALQLSYHELASATRSLKEVVTWAHKRHVHQTEQVATHIRFAHRWIFGAGRILL
jgi:hypothetical protein